MCELIVKLCNYRYIVKLSHAFIVVLKYKFKKLSLSPEAFYLFCTLLSKVFYDTSYL